MRNLKKYLIILPYTFAALMFVSMRMEYLERLYVERSNRMLKAIVERQVIEHRKDLLIIRNLKFDNKDYLREIYRIKEKKMSFVSTVE